jgi:hypothetical protein
MMLLLEGEGAAPPGRPPALGGPSKCAAPKHCVHMQRPQGSHRWWAAWCSWYHTWGTRGLSVASLAALHAWGRILQLSNQFFALPHQRIPSCAQKPGACSVPPNHLQPATSVKKGYSCFVSKYCASDRGRHTGKQGMQRITVAAARVLACQPAWRPLLLHKLRKADVAVIGCMPWVAEHGRCPVKSISAHQGADTSQLQV